jgi:CRISPR-associated protein Cas1
MDEGQAKTRFINLLREQFNSGVRYKGRILKWDTVIEQKATELSRFLGGRSRELDFTEPRPIHVRLDSSNLRNKILSITQQEATKAGIGKGTLHYLRQNAHDPKCFRTYMSVLSRLEALA